MEQATTTASAVATGAVRLTQRVKAGGCASKLAPGVLAQVLTNLPRREDANLLVGFETSDDAGVYRISEHEALVQTVDFFTPMVDDPQTFGKIAAANALSDVYAMGGTPMTALSIVCFPADEDPGLLEAIMRGGLEVMDAAACVVLGGHSVRDAEIKFGYAVTGSVAPDRFFRNCTAQPGDAIVLGKAIGTGVITTALKQGRAQSSWVDAAVQSMTQLNRQASQIARDPAFLVHAVTDVTGFGLIGHAREMALGSGLRLLLRTARIPLLQGALAAVESGSIPAGLLANREFAECFVEAQPERGIPDALRTLLFDPQTSGGLLIALAPEQAPAMVEALCQAGYEAAEIGSAIEGSPKIVLG